MKSNVGKAVEPLRHRSLGTTPQHANVIFFLRGEKGVVDKKLQSYLTNRHVQVVKLTIISWLRPQLIHVACKNLCRMCAGSLVSVWLLCFDGFRIHQQHFHGPVLCMMPGILIDPGVARPRSGFSWFKVEQASSEGKYTQTIGILLKSS